jgi:hypothetical protein
MLPSTCPFPGMEAFKSEKLETDENLEIPAALLQRKGPSIFYLLAIKEEK